MSYHNQIAFIKKTKDSKDISPHPHPDLIEAIGIFYMLKIDFRYSIYALASEESRKPFSEPLGLKTNRTHQSSFYKKTILFSALQRYY
jgi:hypothetical protein